MEAIRESAEHHFLTTLGALKTTSKGWVVAYFGLSKALAHESFVKTPSDIQGLLSKARIKSDAFLQDLVRKASDLKKGTSYLFLDNDVIMLACPESEADKALIQSIYREMAKEIRADFSYTGLLEGKFYKYQKIADEKMLTAKRFMAYETMSDENKISSIAVRRERREDPQVLIVEDDRFMVSYTANILSKDYDLILCRSGEEGIAAYIENAPDIVFLDIHLPGLDGHETLRAIRAVDPAAFVVILSVDSVGTNITRATGGGAHSFLKKPFSKERLINAVKSSPYIGGGGIVSDVDSSPH